MIIDLKWDISIYYIGVLSIQLPLLGVIYTLAYTYQIYLYVCIYTLGHKALPSIIFILYDFESSSSIKRSRIRSRADAIARDISEFELYLKLKS